MSPKIFAEGSLHDKVWTAFVTDEMKSKKFAGFRLKESTLTALVDAGAEALVFVDPNRGRYTSDTDDWYEFGVWDDMNGYVELRQSWMTRA